MAQTANKKVPVKASYSAFWNAGYAVIPENSGIPIKGLQWSCIFTSLWKPDADTLLDWDLSDGYGFGLATGKASGVIIIDLDEATEAQIKKAIEILGDTPVKKFGSKGVSLFYKYNGERNCIWKKNDAMLCELLSDGRKSTLPPSIHKKTKKPYIWTGTKELLEVTPDELPSLPIDYIKSLDSLFSIIREKPREYKTVDQEYNEPDYNEAVKALNHISASCDNDTWVQVGMSLRSTFGDAAFEDFNNWSSKGANYDKNSIRSRWRSFNSHSIGIGTLFYYAKQGGYILPIKERIEPATPSLDPKEYTKMRLIEQSRKAEESDKLPDIVADAPDMIKDLAFWMYSTAIFPQPILSLGAALTTVGFLMGRDFACARSGIKANLYNICIAGSQEGKEHIKSCAQRIMKEFGLLKHYHTSWTSGSAIENVLDQTDGQAYYITDEMGIMMNHLVGKYTNANQQEAVSILLRLYTEGYYKGKGYAKSADHKPVEINNPFVAICGFTQREPFFEAMTSMQAHTGVLNRMCLFKAPDIRPQRNTLYDVEHGKVIPTTLRDKLSTLQASIEYLKIGKSHQSVVKYVPYTLGAASLLKQINKDIDERFRKSQLEGETLHLIIGRNGEVIEKIALIASQGQPITEEILHWAKRVVEYSTGIMLESSQNIVDNEYERKKVRFTEFLNKKGGFASLTEITNSFKAFSNRHEKLQIIEDLKDAGRLQVDKDGNKTIYRLSS